MKIKVLLALILLSIAPNCLSQTDFDYGNVTDNIYTNNYFGIEMTLPKDWFVQSKEQMNDIMQTGKKLMTGNDAKAKAAVKASELNTASLFAAFKYETGAAVDYNPSIGLIAENIKKFPGIKSGKDYLFHFRNFMNQSQLKYDKIDSEATKETINGIEFYKMNAEITYSGIKIKQTFYSSVVNKFTLNFIISYLTDEQKNEMVHSLNSLKYKK